MAYRLESLTAVNDSDLERPYETFDLSEWSEIPISFGEFEITVSSDEDAVTFFPVNPTNGVLPEGYSYVGDELMLALYGEDSAYADYDPSNFNFDNAVRSISIGEIVGPTSNAFTSTITVSNGGNPDNDQYIQQVTDLTQAALDAIMVYIDAAAGASLDVAVTLAQQGPNTVASAGSGSLFFSGDQVNGFDEVVTVSQVEFVTGTDPNGTDPDVVVTINTDFLTSSQAFLETGSNRTPGAGQIDYLSVLIHEILHGLGFFSFRDNSGNLSNPGNPPNIESTYGANITFSTEFGTLVPYYDSANIQNVYGENVLMEYLFNSAGSDVSHFGRFEPNGTETDLRYAIMNPSVVLGDVVTIGAIEIAVFQDLGYSVQNDANLELVNVRDTLPNNVTIDADPGLTTTFSATGINITRSATGTGQGLVSVGVSVTLADGTVQSGRVRLTDNEPFSLFTLSDELLQAIGENGGGDIDVRVFYAANAELASGQIEETSTFTFESQPLTTGDDFIIGSVESDWLVGGDGNDQLRPLDGDDLALGGAGDDFINLGSGDDHGYGGSGADRLRGEDGSDRLYGNDGRDLLRGGSGEDSLFGGADQDFIFGEADADYIEGGAGNDRLYGDAGEDTVYGGDGNDSLNGGNNSDSLFGDGDNDTLRGDAGNDSLFGGEGDDLLFGGEDADELFGENGDDTLFGGAGGDVLLGGTGIDLLFGQAESDTLHGGDGADRLFGGDGNDTLNGDADNDLLQGGNNDDVLNGGSGDDFLNGGAGMDTLSGGDDLDTLVGRAGNDILFGEGGDDRLFGDGDNDILDGGAGSDRLNGGTGADTFVFAAGYGIDVIQDFEDGVDLIDASAYSNTDIQTAIDNAFIASNYLILDFGNGDQLRLANITLGEITLDDFTAMAG